MEPDTTIIAGASSWRGTFTQCGGIPRMMAGSLVVAGEQVGQQQQAASLVVVGLLHHLSIQVGTTTTSRQPGGGRRTTRSGRRCPFSLPSTKQETMRRLSFV